MLMPSAKNFLSAFLISAIVCGGFQSVQAQTVEERVQARVADSIAGVIPAVFELDDEGQVIGVLDARMVYRVFLPSGYDPEERYPLILYLHGSGNSGTNNTGQIGRVLDTMILETDINRPAILLAPQLAQSTGWSPYNPMDRTDEILELLLDNYSIDTDRMYLTGLSMGGFGATEYMTYYHQDFPGLIRFAAAAITAGAFVSEFSADTLSETPIWFSHGANDTTVDPDFSLNGFNRVVGRPDDTPFMPDLGLILASGGPTDEEGIHRLTIYPTRGHGTWQTFYNGSLDVYDWLFAQSLPKPFGDYNDDGIVDCRDLDVYVGNMGADATGSLADLDLTLNGTLEVADADLHIRFLVQTSNGEVGTFLGDLNCDGHVDVLGDALILVGNLGNSVTRYSDGDIDFDGSVTVLSDAFTLVRNLGRTNE